MEGKRKGKRKEEESRELWRGGKEITSAATRECYDAGLYNIPVSRLKSIYSVVIQLGYVKSARHPEEIYINRFLQAKTPGEPGGLQLWLMMSAAASLATGPLFCVICFLIGIIHTVRSSSSSSTSSKNKYSGVWRDGKNALCHVCLAALLPQATNSHVTWS